MVGFYRLVERPCGMGRSTIGMGLQATSVTREVSGRCGRSWRSSRWSRCGGSVVKHSGTMWCPTGQRRLSTSSASATGHLRVGGYVWACPGVVAVVVEEGEDEARSAATGSVGVCGCVSARVRARDDTLRRQGRVLVWALQR